ncbi:hypothetical protein VP01_1866g1 [Puccinia sorghi]|uniref:Uncharacterized protein n=1 Tax=Puccinia sorghi TaxID=27349 RepID=A0A0L6VDW3_9BASI|nr:hypothetical protein VP01_1866g1 [Puccinia sorghi]
MYINPENIIKTKKLNFFHQKAYHNSQPPDSGDLHPSAYLVWWTTFFLASSMMIDPNLEENAVETTCPSISNAARISKDKKQFTEIIQEKKQETIRMKEKVEISTKSNDMKFRKDVFDDTKNHVVFDLGGMISFQNFLGCRCPSSKNHCPTQPLNYPPRGYSKCHQFFQFLFLKQKINKANQHRNQRWVVWKNTMVVASSDFFGETLTFFFDKNCHRTPHRSQKISAAAPSSFINLQWLLAKILVPRMSENPQNYQNRRKKNQLQYKSKNLTKFEALEFKLDTKKNDPEGGILNDGSIWGYLKNGKLNVLRSSENLSMLKLLIFAGEKRYSGHIPPFPAKPSRGVPGCAKPKDNQLHPEVLEPPGGNKRTSAMKVEDFHNISGLSGGHSTSLTVSKIVVSVPDPPPISFLHSSNFFYNQKAHSKPTNHIGPFPSSHSSHSLFSFHLSLSLGLLSISFLPLSSFNLKPIEIIFLPGDVNSLKSHFVFSSSMTNFLDPDYIIQPLFPVVFLLRFISVSLSFIFVNQSSTYTSLLPVIQIDDIFPSCVRERKQPILPKWSMMYISLHLIHHINLPVFISALHFNLSVYCHRLAVVLYFLPISFLFLFHSFSSINPQLTPHSFLLFRCVLASSLSLQSLRLSPLTTVSTVIGVCLCRCCLSSL